MVFGHLDDIFLKLSHFVNADVHLGRRHTLLYARAGEERGCDIYRSLLFDVDSTHYSVAVCVCVCVQAVIHVLLMRAGVALGTRWDALLPPPPAPSEAVGLMGAVMAAVAPRFTPSHVANHLFLLNLAQVNAHIHPHSL